MLTKSPSPKIAAAIAVVITNLLANLTFDQTKATAQTASIAGSATLTIQPNITNQTITTNGVTTQTITQVGGYTSSVSGEVVLPTGLYFNGTANITPTYTDSLVSNLSIAASSTAVVPKETTFTRASAEILINAAAGTIEAQNIDLITAIIRAGAGVNGLD